MELSVLVFLKLSALAFGIFRLDVSPMSWMWSCGKNQVRENSS
jgi:hypothetical protein